MNEKNCYITYTFLGENDKFYFKNFIFNVKILIDLTQKQ
jgi:hypothetical protein